MKVRVDVDACVGGGQCVLAASDVFDQDDDGLVVVLQNAPEQDRAEDVRMAARLCPARAITVDDA